jgi:phthiodiolone/phenolphthiodiolone dimycocerosates ketoreductase
MRLGALVRDAEAWREAGGVHPFGEGFRGMRDFVPRRIGHEEVREAMEKVPRDVLHALLPHGTPDEIAALVRTYERAGLRHVILDNVVALGKPSRALPAFAALARTRRALRREGAA